jgi:hypothetical protein
MDSLTPCQLGWVAGLLEGEGAFFLNAKRSTTGETYYAGTIACNMTDEDVLRRVADLTGVGKFNGPTVPPNPRHKPYWRWQVHKRQDVLALAKAILPLMGQRRTIRLQEVIDALDGTGRPARQHGKRHSYNCGCRCDTCRAAHAKHAREYRQHKKDVAA